MPPDFEIVSVRNSGPTDNEVLDTLYVVQLRKGDAEPQRFLFSVLQRHGQPNNAELEALIRRRAASFDCDCSALEQFRELEQPHPRGHPDRRAVSPYSAEQYG